MKLYQLAALINKGTTMLQRHRHRVHEPREDRRRPTFDAYLNRARPQHRQPVAVTDHSAHPEQPTRHPERPEFVVLESPAHTEQPVRHHETPSVAALVRGIQPRRQPPTPQQETRRQPPVPQQETPPVVAPISTAPTEPITLAFFKQLRDDASDRKYPLDGTKRREQHENYARMLLDRVRAARSQMGAAAAAEGSYSGQSWGASHTTFDQIFAALDEVERFMDDQAQRVSSGENVTLIEGRHRHLLSDALGKLYFEMKDFFNAVDAG